MRVAINVCVPPYGHWWLWLVTYDTREKLVAASERYYGQPEPEDEAAVIEGMFCKNYFSDTSYLGLMRLYDLSTQTIIHESVHAASCMANKVHGCSRTLSKSKEEAIAYGTEAITTAVYAAIHPDEGYEALSEQVDGGAHHRSAVDGLESLPGDEGSGG